VSSSRFAKVLLFFLLTLLCVSSIDLPTPIFGYIGWQHLVGVVFFVWLPSWISSPLNESQVSLQFDSYPLTESLAFFNPSCMHHFMNVQLVNKLQIPVKNIYNT